MANHKSNTSKQKNTNSSSSSIAHNRKARFEYQLEQKFEAGIALQGWEVKSLRQGKVQLVDSYVIIKNTQAWLLNSIISPLISASTHIKPDPARTRKLLLHRKEIDNLIGLTKQKGYTLIPLSIYWSKNNKVKLEFALAKGKKNYDKRNSTKDREWQVQKQRLFKKNTRDA